MSEITIQAGGVFIDGVCAGSPADAAANYPDLAVAIGAALAATPWDAVAPGAVPAPAAGGVPQQVTRLQAKLALHTHGLLDDVEAVVTAAGGATLLYWTDALVFERQHPIIVQLGSVLGLTPEAIDALFVDAATY